MKILSDYWKDKELHISVIYYIAVIVCYVLTAFCKWMHPGVASTLFMLCVLAEFVVKRIWLPIMRKEFKLSDCISKLYLCDYIALAYFLYNVISFCWAISSVPVSVYVQEFTTSILPMVFYLVGRQSLFPDKREDEESFDNTRFYRGFLTALFLLCFVGLTFYITAPQFYLDYLHEWLYTSKADASTMRVRMQSVVGATMTGYLSVCGMIASSVLFLRKRTRILGIIGFVVGFIFVLLSSMRSAMVVAFLIILYMNILVFYLFRILDKKFIFIELGVIVVGVALLCLLLPSMADKLLSRLASLPLAIGERSETWVAAVNSMKSSWFGNGLSVNGHRAIGIEGLHVVTDGGLVKLFCEEGVIGFSMFLYMILLLFRKGMRNFRYAYAEMMLVAATLLQSIGSNILSFQLAAPFFWYVCGRLGAHKEEHK